MKIIGLRFQYFTAGWNVFDFVLVIASIIGIVMEDMMTDFPVSPTLLRVARVCRIGRILRYVRTRTIYEFLRVGIYSYDIGHAETVIA